MKFSKLKHEIEILELTQKHEVELLKVKQEQALKELKNKCIHKFDDGSSAKQFRGTQWNEYYSCDICGKTL